MNDLSESLNEVVRTRRSIYTNMFSGEAVKDSIIEEMLENANWAPTHKLTEPWRFVVFTGEGLKKLSNFQGEIYKRKNQNNFDEQKFRKYTNKPLECSHVVAIGMKRDPKATIPEVEEICSVACAVQNMLLTASAHKVGCYWSTGGVTFDEEAKAFFSLGEEDKLLGFLYVGMPSGGKWPKGKRKPILEKVKWERSS